MFTQEELLEAVDILVEDYGYDEEDAIDMVNEAYEAELDELSEAVDILMEDYGYDEDEAIDMIMESYEEDFEDEDGLFSEGKRNFGFAKAEGLAQKARKGLKRQQKRFKKTSEARKRKMHRKAQMKKLNKRIDRAKKAMHVGGGRRRRRC